MEPVAKVRDPSKMVATSRGCAPLKATYDSCIRSGCRTWYQAEDLFLRGIQAFDANVVSGVAKTNDVSHAKVEFFTDLIALLLTNGADVDLYRRAGIPGYTYPRHELDIAYPLMGAVQFVAEGKALGTPPMGPKGTTRYGSTGLDTCLLDFYYQSIDLKAETAGTLAQSGQRPEGPSADFSGWIHSMGPKTYSFVAVRVQNERDRDQVVEDAGRAARVTDGVGIYCYVPVAPDQPATYKSLQVPERLELGVVLARACQDLVEIKGRLRGKPPAAG